MLRRVLAQPAASAAATTLAAVAISFAFTGLVLTGAHIPFPPIAMALALGLPAVIVPSALMPFVKIASKHQTVSAELERMKRTDALTELPNRRAFFEFAGPLVSSRVPKDAPVTAMIVDVDHLKRINESYGQDAGDTVLRRVAHVIREEVAATGAREWTVARIGGEEFALVVDRLVPPEAATLAERICGGVHRWVGAGEKEQPVSVSVGVAFRSPEMCIDRLLKAANDAVALAKDEGRNRWAFAGGKRKRKKAPKHFAEPANDWLAAS
jgi:diguanylate cyclase (GGDEF)-like protein